MKNALLSAFVLSALSACSSAAVVPDAGYCPPGQGMPMPELCKQNDPCNTGNSLHVGAWCTQNGNQCAQYGLICGLDADSIEGENFCVVLCTLNSECGENACCTADPQNHHQGQRACVPISCPDDICDGG